MGNKRSPLPRNLCLCFLFWFKQVSEATSDYQIKVKVVKAVERADGDEAEHEMGSSTSGVKLLPFPCTASSLALLSSIIIIIIYSSFMMAC